MSDRLNWSDVIDTERGGRKGKSLEWTAYEVISRAERAEQAWHEILQRHRRNMRPEQLTPTQRALAFKKAQAEQKKWVKSTTGGVQGMPSFSQLSYFGVSQNKLLSVTSLTSP